MSLSAALLCRLTSTQHIAMHPCRNLFVCAIGVCANLGNADMMSSVTTRSDIAATTSRMVVSTR